MRKRIFSQRPRFDSKLEMIKDSQQHDSPGNNKIDSKSSSPQRQKKNQKNKNKKRGKSVDAVEFEQQKEEAKKKIQEEKQQNNNRVEEKNVVIKQIVKGQCAVDECFRDANLFHVLYENTKLYDCLMNQTNISGNRNNNKFYIVQVLESDNPPYTYYCLTRWGRIGQQGQHIIKNCSKQDAIVEYESKVYDKSVKGDYRVLHKQYAQINNTHSEEDQYNQSKLHPKIKDLIKLIFDLKMMDMHMAEIGYDPTQMPLGQLAIETINQGYRVLKQIAELISKKKPQKTQLEMLSSEFYSQIPHNYGFKKAPIIQTHEDIKKKLEMLATLEQIQIATKMIASNDGNVFDTNYSKLNCNITYVSPNSETYQMIDTYIQNTHASTHNQYKLKIIDIYEIDKEIDNKRFKDVGNRMLLWHGSRLSNFVGILTQGLRIAPPEAPVTGYMFGKGVYFADMVSKSANYCCASRSNPYALILLCDVALGKWQDRFHADYYASELPQNINSTKGVGKTAPSSMIKFKDFQVPCGKWEEKVVKESDLLYNEYIVYDVSQIKLKYLIKLFYKFI